MSSYTLLNIEQPAWSQATLITLVETDISFHQKLQHVILLFSSRSAMYWWRIWSLSFDKRHFGGHRWHSMESLSSDVNCLYCVQVLKCIKFLAIKLRHHSSSCRALCCWKENVHVDMISIVSISIVLVFDIYCFFCSISIVYIVLLFLLFYSNPLMSGATTNFISTTTKQALVKLLFYI